MGGAYAPDAARRAASRVRSAQADPDRVRLEGVHAVKHAVRFGADIEVLVTADPDAVASLLEDLAPDVADAVLSRTTVLDAATWASLVPRALPSPLLGVAARPHRSADDVLAGDGPVVVLEGPRHLGNLGAAIRGAAAAGAGGLLVLGAADPWHPTAVRGSAGLGFALPVAAADVLPATERPILALDADGEPLRPGSLPADAVLLVGTERGGLTPTARARATHNVAIGMRPGVSSLNLATAVTVALYLGR